MTGPAPSGMTATTLWEVEDILRAVVGRSFASRAAARPGGAELYLLGHEELLATALRYLDEGKAEALRARLHTWCDRYQAAGWPTDTPEYLLIEVPTY